MIKHDCNVNEELLKGITEHLEEKKVIQNRGDDTGSYHIIEQSEILIAQEKKIKDTQI